MGLGWKRSHYLTQNPGPGLNRSSPGPEAEMILVYRGFISNAGNLKRIGTLLVIVAGLLFMTSLIKRKD